MDLSHSQHLIFLNLHTSETPMMCHNTRLYPTDETIRNSKQNINDDSYCVIGRLCTVIVTLPDRFVTSNQVYFLQRGDNNTR